MTDTTAIIRDLARAKVAIQMHTIAAVIDQRPTPQETMMSDEEIRIAERERIAAALEYEASLITCVEDEMVTRGNARLIRANFSYDVAEKLDDSAQPGGGPTYTAAEATALVRAALEAAQSATFERRRPSGEESVGWEAGYARALVDVFRAIRALDPLAIVAAHKGDTDDR